MASKAEKAAAKKEAAEKAAQAKREAAERAAQAKREAAEKKAEQQRAAAEKAAEAKRAKVEQQKSAADAKAAAAQKAKDDKANKAKAAADNKAKAAADKAAAAEKAATTYNDQGLNAAQQAQIAKLQKIANQPVSTYQGLGGSGNNQAAIDKAKAEIAKIEAQGKTVLDKQYQEKNAPKMQEARDKLKASRAQEAQAAQQAQAARVAQVQNRQQQVGQEMAQRQDPNQSYANPYFAMTQNMPAPVGMFQGPNSQQAQTTMIGAGGNQPQQMSPAQMAQMAHMQQMQGQGYGPPEMPQQQGMPPGMPPQGIAQGMPPGMGQQGMPQGIPPQILAMLQARQAQQQPAPQQQAPQGQPVRQDMSTFNAQAPVMAAYGGIMRGYR